MIDELNKLTYDSVVAFWGGQRLKPGLYQRDFKNTIKNKKLIMEESGELIIPKLNKIKELNNKYVFYEKLLDSERGMVILSMPTWDYYQLDDNLDTDHLVTKSGFFGPIKNPIDIYIRNVKK